ncbi:MAG: ABC transporter permease [Chloroflexi bacterium]|nr:ABC transporter permease [Chloroflexota bacterium]
MTRYLIRRVLWLFVILWGISLITFVITYAVPSDPARALAGPEADDREVANIRHQLGLDRPFHEQYGAFLWRAVQGDFGRSWRLRMPVMEAILVRLPATAQLAVAALLAELVIGLTIGTLSALKQNTILDRGATLIAIVSLAAPGFWVGLLLLYYLAFRANLFPLGGYGTPLHVVLPALTMGITGGPWYAQIFRSTLLDVLGEDYVRTAHAKGLKHRMVVLRHIVPNAVRPVITMAGMDLGHMLAGVLVIESVFAWPGIGTQTWEAITTMDVPIVVGTVMFAAFLIAVANLLVDLSYALLDPRVRYS